MGDSPADPR